MRRRSFLLAPAAAPSRSEPHFPHPLYQLLWRNWDLVPLARLAAVTGAPAAQLQSLARDLGLPPQRPLSEDSLRRTYITVLRQNWHLLPPDQLVRLLGWTPERLAFTLKEDDFLDHKLGPAPAGLPPVGAALPDAAQRRAARALPRLLRPGGEPRLAFIPRLSAPLPNPAPEPTPGAWSPRFLYSYFALYGDPLLEGDAAGLPDGYLARIAAAGIDGVWIQGLLSTLAPSATFPEFGQNHELRLRNLRALIARAARFGLKVHLYLNEPRAMPAAFFAQRPGLRGTRDKDLYALCTSTPEVLAWLRDSVAFVFREAPGLGGILTITMSENHTNCFSHGGAWGDRDPVARDCPRCSRRTGAEVIAELLQALRDGVRRQDAGAEIMAYDWGWGTPLADALIPRLPRDTGLISISEWAQPVSRGGVQTTVGEYSMSVVGPGPRARRNWALARRHGLRAIAKTQFNNTWEISAVPYIPVLPLVLEHCENLRREGIHGVMASWTCGGYPSPNLRAVAAFARDPQASRDAILQAEAVRLYGPAAAPRARQAWDIFSEAFQLFPYGVSIYILPVQHGPANLLRLTPTGLAPGMILFPHDAWQKWCGSYPPAVVQQLLERLAARWSAGVALLERLAAPGAEARLELAVARTCQAHFQSAANQLAFYRLRDDPAAPDRPARMIALAQAERALALRQYAVARDESLIGYEASNHYYYTPNDLIEKVFNCDWVIATLRAERR